MEQNIDKIYKEAIASGLLPGVSLIAGDKDGNILYSKSFGKASTKEGDERPFTESTIAFMASMTKLMTSVAVLQCVEDGTLDLDQDVKPLLPDVGKYGLINGFDDASNTATLTENSTPITLRMLLSHTSGYQYDWASPLLRRWRISRNEVPWAGATIEEKAALPLVHAPGKGWAYGPGHEWAGRAIEVATKSTLEDFMHARIWTPLGIENDSTFFPLAKEGLKERMAELSTLNEKGEPPAVPSDLDLRGGSKVCLGGGGLCTSTKGYYTFLSAVLRRDPKLLNPASYTELFRAQLDDECEQALNDSLAAAAAPPIYLNLNMQTPASVRKSFGFAGLVVKDGQEGRCAPGTLLWGGFPSTAWFIDPEAGICGTAVCQILPPFFGPIMDLHTEFQRIIYSEAKGKQ
ncbi:beta-lactamase/transpeptidase-like protein [Hypoxylon fragiforme]|uniref:beta-lactamase/transpeptidase-like protein n=1 Tax=Hypoxylon fragiforme TaxID=63214 RepID=UPI0020C5F8A7|nr:beta-lactamase/transpeptidase-like protein [Hypoxylon fragiforme]KAI2605717.1 beta-lactamase/transpeptidase-like protein [Hypoxylon fragiforme]